MENPVFPDIKKGPPRFVNAGKNWMVDPGATMRDTEPMTQFTEHAVLVQSRDYNKTAYGQSSHRDVVNAEFRPPIQSPYEDFGPVTRIPCTIHSIKPRINPQPDFRAQIEDPEVVRFLSDRVHSIEHYGINGSGVEGFEVWNIPQTPDLQTKSTPYSVSSGASVPYHHTTNPESQPSRVGISVKPNVSAHSFSNVPLVSSPQPHQNPKLGHAESFSVTSGVSGSDLAANFRSNPTKIVDNPLTVSTNSGFVVVDRDLSDKSRLIPELQYSNPRVSVGSGFTSTVTHSERGRTPDLKNTIPNVSVHSGMDMPMVSDITIQSPELRSGMPSTSVFSGFVMGDVLSDNQSGLLQNPKLGTAINVSVGSGVESGYTHFITPQNPRQLNSKVASVISFVNPVNPSSESQKVEKASDYRPENIKISNKQKSSSYFVPPTTQYKNQNEKTYQPHFRERIQPLKSYGSVSQSSGFIPRMGIEQPQIDLRHYRK